MTRIFSCDETVKSLRKEGKHLKKIQILSRMRKTNYAKIPLHFRLNSQIVLDMPTRFVSVN